MELKDLEKELNEKPQEVNTEAVTEALQQAEEPKQPDQAEAAEAGTEETETVNLMQFGQVITNLYCGLSDFVYKRVKKTQSAPEWQPETKEAIEDSLTAFLAQYNVQMTPTVQLIVVLGSIEAARYTIMKPKQIEQKTSNGKNE